MATLIDTAKTNLSQEPAVPGMDLTSPYGQFKFQYDEIAGTPGGQRFIAAVERNGLSDELVETFNESKLSLINIGRAVDKDPALGDDLIKAMDTYKGNLGPHIEKFSQDATRENLAEITGSLRPVASPTAAASAPTSSAAPAPVSTGAATSAPAEVTSEPLALIAETAQKAPMPASSSAPAAKAEPKSDGELLKEYGSKLSDFVNKSYPGEFDQAALEGFENRMATDVELQASILEQIKKNPGLVNSFDKISDDSPASLAARNALRPYITDAIENPDVLKNPNFMKGAQGAARDAAAEEMGSSIMDGFLKGAMAETGMTEFSMNGILDMFRPFLASIGIDMDKMMNNNTMLASNGSGGEIFNNFIGAMSGNQMASNNILNVDNNQVYNVASAPDGEMRITGEDGKLLKPPVRTLAMSDPGLSAGGPVA